jgi:hypothetical protein
MNVDTGAISSADRDMCEFNIGKKPFYVCRKNAPCSKQLCSCYGNNAINKFYLKIQKKNIIHPIARGGHTFSLLFTFKKKYLSKGSTGGDFYIAEELLLDF